MRWSSWRTSAYIGKILRDTKPSYVNPRLKQMEVTLEKWIPLLPAVIYAWHSSKWFQYGVVNRRNNFLILNAYKLSSVNRSKYTIILLGLWEMIGLKSIDWQNIAGAQVRGSRWISWTSPFCTGDPASNFLPQHPA